LILSSHSRRAFDVSRDLWPLIATFLFFAGFIFPLLGSIDGFPISGLAL
jgi:hypothetical protein